MPKTDRIIVSRTDSIGDVMLTLPLCGMLRRHFPQAEIHFIGKAYTRAVIEACSHVDVFHDADAWMKEDEAFRANALRSIHADAIVHVFPDKAILKAARAARIPLRIGTAGRWSSVFTLNRPVFFSRKNSDLHESQLNLHLLAPLGIRTIPPLEEIPLLYGFRAQVSLPARIPVPDTQHYHVILHPLSKGSAVEWGVQHFASLIRLLDPERFRVYITGTASEGERLRAAQVNLEAPHVTNLCGQLNLDELITFIGSCDALVAASTGPLHIAAALGRQAIGLYTPQRPMHPGRWAPVGTRAEVCVAAQHPAAGDVLAITPEAVMQRLVRGADGTAGRC